VWKYRISLGLVLFGLAGICALLGWGTSMVFGKLALWFGAASFTWKGVRALSGKTGPPLARPAALPHPPTRPHSAPPAPAKPGDVWQAARSTSVNTGRGIVRFYIVLGLVLWVPMTLGVAIDGIVTLFKGNAPRGGLMCALAGFMVWYLCGPLLTMWRGLSDEGEVDRDAGPFPEQVAASMPSGHDPHWRPQVRILPEFTGRDSAMSPSDLWRLRKHGVRTLGTVVDHVLPRQPFGKGVDRPVIAFADLQGGQRTMTPDLESRFIPVDEHLPLVYLPDKPQCAKLSSNKSRRSLPVLLSIALLFTLALFGWLTGVLPTTDKGFMAAVFISGGLVFLASIGQDFRRLSTLHRHGVRTTGTATRMYAKSDVEAGVVVDFFDSRNRRIQFVSTRDSHAVGARVPLVYLRDDPTLAEVDTPLRNFGALIIPTLICLAFTTAGVAVLFLPFQPGQ
jgi:hypothetical protein